MAGLGWRMLSGLMVFGLALAGLDGVARAQDLVGTWQGTLHAGRDLRLVIKLEKNDAAYKGTAYSIDQNVSFPVTATLQSSTVKMLLPRIDSAYDGKLASDNKTITGQWTQGPKPIDLSLSRATPETAWAIPEPPPKLAPMAANADPSFDVATIKPSKPDQPGKAFMIRGRQFSTVNTTLEDMMTFVYGLHPSQIVGAPAWVATAKFDVQAKPDGEGAPSQEQWKTMVRKMIAERFQLKFHEEKKELSVYVLRVAKSGPKLTKSDQPSDAGPSLFFRGLGDFPVRNATMEQFAQTMQAAVLDRPVVDETGLQGRWDLNLKWTPDESQFQGMGVKIPPPSNAPDAPPPLFTAIQEQDGLRLEPTKAPVKVFVIDHAEQPSAN